MRIAVILALLPLAAFAETPLIAPPPVPMTGAEFDAYATGQTLTYAQDGAIWGTEQYKADRKVIWAFTAAECREGYWYEQDQDICFVYEDPDNPQCWLFFLGPNGLQAQYSGDSAGVLSEVQQTNEPMACYGPDVGV